MLHKKKPPCKKRLISLSLHSLKSSKVSAAESKSFEIQNNREEKLEDRLWSVLCCAVCLELPLSAIYQCSQGHLICVQCFHHLLADARYNWEIEIWLERGSNYRFLFSLPLQTRLKEEPATCASCRCLISKENCTRNLAVEKACREMPSHCQHCNRRVARFQLNSHENEECEERPVICQYSKIGCPWLGPFHEKGESSSLHRTIYRLSLFDFLSTSLQCRKTF